MDSDLLAQQNALQARQNMDRDKNLNRIASALEKITIALEVRMTDEQKKSMRRKQSPKDEVLKRQTAAPPMTLEIVGITYGV
jgi:hypothetical protein